MLFSRAPWLYSTLLFDYNLQATALLPINLSQIVSVIMQIPSD